MVCVYYTSFVCNNKGNESLILENCFHFILVLESKLLLVCLISNIEYELENELE